MKIKNLTIALAALVAVACGKKGATPEELKILLGRGRAKKGIFEGDLIEGELEIGQVSAQINEIKSVKEIMEELTEGFKRVKNNLNNFDF